MKSDMAKEIVLCKTWEGNRDEVGLRNCTKAFRLHPLELDFYRRYVIPLPRKCPNCREFDRLKKRNPARLYKRQCQCVGIKSENGIYTNTVTHQHGTGKCPNEFETSYPPESPTIVYCEPCYQSEVV